VLRTKLKGSKVLLAKAQEKLKLISDERKRVRTRYELVRLLIKIENIHVETDPLDVIERVMLVLALVIIHNPRVA
jgi:hypothetical protein